MRVVDGNEAIRAGGPGLGTGAGPLESILAGLPREELDLAAGCTLAPRGSFLRDVYYLVEGTVDLMVESAGRPRRAARIERGNFFHLSSYPAGDFHTAEATAAAPSIVWRVDAGVLKKALAGNKPLEDELLRTRKLEKLLVLFKRSAVFSFLDASSLEELDGQIDLVEVRKGRTVSCGEGVFFLLFGQAEVSGSRGAKGGFLSIEEDDFWFAGFSGDEAGSLTARTHLAGVRISPAGIGKLVRMSGAFGRALKSRAAKIEGRMKILAGSIVARKKLSFLAEHGLMHVQAPPVIDLSRCIRCRSCEEACRRRHGAGRIDIAGSVKFGFFTFPASCRVCKVPSCLPVCSKGALHRAGDGRVAVESDLCAGCGACAKACDFGGMRIVPVAGRAEGSGGSGGGLGVAKADKCDHCEGYGDMACVRECPTGALSRRMPEELASLLYGDE